MSMHKIPMELIMAVMPEPGRSKVEAIRKKMSEMTETHAARMGELTESMKLKYGFRGPAIQHLIAMLAKNTSLIKLIVQVTDVHEGIAREITSHTLDMVANSIAACAFMAQNLPLDTDYDKCQTEWTNDDKEIVAWAKMLFEEEMKFNFELHKAGMPLSKIVADFIESTGGRIGD